MIQRSNTHQQRSILKNKCCWCVFVIIFLFRSYGHAQAVSISPSRLFFTGNPGQELTQQITLTNSGQNQVIFKASLMDWERDSIGEKHYYQPGTRLLSNAPWVEVMPNVVEIQPGSKQQITVTLHVPNSAQNTVKNTMLFLSQINEQKVNTNPINKATIGVIIKLEFGVHVYYTPPGVSHKDLDFVSFDDQGVKALAQNQKVHRVAVKVKSLSNVITDGFLNFEVTNKITGDEFKVSPKAISMLPGAEQIIYLDLPLTLTGHYLLVALLDGGEETNLKVAKKEVDLGN